MSSCPGNLLWTGTPHSLSLTQDELSDLVAFILHACNLFGHLVTDCTFTLFDHFRLDMSPLLRLLFQKRIQSLKIDDLPIWRIKLDLILDSKCHKGLLQVIPIFLGESNLLENLGLSCHLPQLTERFHFAFLLHPSINKIIIL